MDVEEGILHSSNIYTYGTLALYPHPERVLGSLLDISSSHPRLDGVIFLCSLTTPPPNTVIRTYTEILLFSQGPPSF